MKKPLRIQELICPACGYQWTDEEMTSDKLFFEDCPVCEANMVQPASDYFTSDGKLRPEINPNEDRDGS